MEEATQKLLDAQRWREAIPCLIEELDRAPEDQTLTYNLIACYLNLKDYKNAKKALSFADSLNEKDIKKLEDELEKIKPKPSIQKPPKVKERYSTRTETAEGLVKQFGWTTPTITFNDVIGLNKVKKEIRDKIIGPMLNPDLYRRMGSTTSNAVILYGPPGSGKTMLAKAVAGEAKSKLLIARSSDLISRFQGDSSRNIAKLMETGREKAPAIIFIDELDALAQKRSNAEGSTTGPEERRILDTFLTELDGAGRDNSSLFVLGASNVPWDIDVAFRRSGRFSRSIYVSPPTQRDRMKLFEYYMRNKSKGNLNYLKLAMLTSGYTGADINAVCDEAASQKASAVQFEGKPETPITTDDIARQIKKLPEPTLFEFYSTALEQLRNMPAEQQNQYPALKKDIITYYSKGKARAKVSRLLGKFAIG